MHHTRSLLAATLLAAALLHLCTASLLADDWPCWLGPNHDGKSLDKGLLKEWPNDGPTLLWKVSGIGVGFSSVTVAGGKVYITGDDRDRAYLSAFDLDGKLLWKVACGRYYKNNFGDGCRGSATVDNGNVYTLDGHGLLTCQDAATGEKQWSRDAVKDFGGDGGHWGYSESPLILGDWVVFKPGGKNCIVALDKVSGKEVWLSTGFEAGKEYSSIIPFVVGDKPMLVTGTSEGLVCVKATTGELAWKNGSYASNTANCPTPAYSAGYVFWANGYGKGGLHDAGSRRHGHGGMEVPRHGLPSRRLRHRRRLRLW